MQAEHHVLEQDQNLMINQITPLLNVHEAQNNSIESLAAHPKWEYFATGSHNHNIKIWDVAKLKEKTTLSEHKEGVWSLDYNHDGSRLASAGPDKTVLIWENKSSKSSIRIDGHKDKVYCVKFNETGKLIGTCGEQGQLFIWDLAKTKEPLARLSVPSLIAYDIRWSGNQQFFFVSTLGSQLLAFDAKNFAQISSSFVTENDKDSKCETICANFKQIDNRIFVGTSRGAIAWYEFKNKKLVKTCEWTAHMDSVRTINYHPTKKVLLTTGRDGSAKLWDASNNDVTPTILGNLVHHKQNIPGAAFIGEDKVATGSWDQDLALWNISQLIK